MSLSADQKATLQLLLERGQSYGDLAGLLDVPEDEVRERARSALRELAGAEPDRNVGLTDYLLGQSDPIGRADAVRQLRDDPDDHRLASELVERLREIAPAAELPRLPGEPRGGRFLRRPPRGGGEGAAPADDRAGSRPTDGRFTPGQARLVVGLSAASVLLVAIVLGVTGAFSGNGNGSEPAQEEEPAELALGDFLLDAPGETVLRGPVPLDEEPPAEDDPDEIRVELSPVGGAEATGEATFGLTGGDTVFVELDLRGLDPPSEDETHVLWLMPTRDQGWPLSPLEPSPNGVFDERLPIPAGLLPLVAEMRFVAIEITPNQVLADLIEDAVGQAPDPALGADPGIDDAPG